MKIYRSSENMTEINGNIEIELTAEELINAYREQEHIYDIEDLQNEDDCYGIQHGLGLEVGCELTDDEWDKAAYELREIYERRYGRIDWMSLNGLAKEAIRKVVDKRSK